MPFLGLGGLHILVAIFFAIHAVRSGQQMYWLLILFMFPLFGSIVYFVAIYLPDSRLPHGARKVASGAVRALDPGRELRAARAALEDTPTAQNQMRLAAALLDAGQAAEAADCYEVCLNGPFAKDNEIRFAAARAAVECGRCQSAIERLQAIRSEELLFRPEELSLLLGRALGGAGHQAEARAEFDSALARFGSFDAKAEAAIWAASAGEAAFAKTLADDIERSTQRWSRHTRDLNAATLRRLREALGSR